MKRIFLAVALFIGASAAIAQTGNLIPLTGAGGRRPAAATYQGPGDVVSGAFAWYSCARAYTAAYAAGGASAKACRVVKTSDGSGGCDLLISSNGFVADPATQCATECSVACSVTTAYDQSGNGRNAVQATLANMPGLTVSGLNSLPVIDCSVGATSLQTSSSFAWSSPTALSTVYIRTSGTATAGAIGDSAIWYLGTINLANTANITGNTGSINAAATDNTWHALQGLLNGSSPASLIRVDAGSDTTGSLTVSGTTNLRLCRGGAHGLIGKVAEGGVWQSALTSTDRDNLYANQHGANGYNGGV